MSNQKKLQNLICFRVDASIQIGSGHVERCLTLSKALNEQGIKIHFICRDHNGHMEDRIKSEGFEITMLSSADEYLVEPDFKHENKSSLGASWELDAHDTSKVLSKLNPIWLIVDHYAIDVSWEKAVKSSTGVKIMAIDGLANRNHDCDMLLDQTYSLDGEKRWNNLIPSYCKLLSGAQYAILRPEFIKEKRELRQRTGAIKRILISFGGVDMNNLTSKALEAILLSNCKNILVDIVIGKNHPNLADLKLRCEDLNYVNLHIQTSQIAKLMSLADLSIGAGGMMIWERCYLGLPSILVAIADNQINQAKAVHTFGAAIYLGVFQKDIKKRILKELNKLYSDPSLNISLSKKSLELINIPNLSSNKDSNYPIVDELLRV